MSTRVGRAVTHNTFYSGDLTFPATVLEDHGDVLLVQIMDAPPHFIHQGYVTLVERRSLIQPESFLNDRRERKL